MAGSFAATLPPLLGVWERKALQLRLVPPVLRRGVLLGDSFWGSEGAGRGARRLLRRVCPTPTDIVHHRKPGLNDLLWLITLCAACHATAHRLQVLDRYLPPLLIELWREQHPDVLAAQLQLELGEA